jgi:hypothetical protein
MQTIRYTGKWKTYPTLRSGHSKMTAIAIVCAPWGAVMAADGLMISNAGQPPREHTQKVFPIINSGRTMLFALAGACANDDFSCDLRVEFMRQAAHLSSKEFTDPVEYSQSLGTLVAAAVTKARHLPKTPGMDLDKGRWKIADAIMVGCFESLIFGVRLELSHSNEMVESRINQYDDRPHRLVLGSELIRDSIYDSNGNPIASSPLAKYAYRIGQTPLVSEATRFAVGYIEACWSEEGRQMDPKGCEAIGGHIHAASVKPRAGFQWIIPPLEDPSLPKSPCVL